MIVTTSAVSPIALALLYWLHMLATIVWIGGLAAITLLVIPAARKALDAPAYQALLGQIQKRLGQMGWFSLAVLIVTGMFQMSASPFYGGFLAITNSWSVAILSKHVVIGAMILVSAYLTWGVLPAMQRAAWLRAAGKAIDPVHLEQLRLRETWLLRLSLLLSVLVLALTAWARAAQ